MSNQDELTAAALSTGLNTRIVGRELELLPQVPSTNDLLRERARAGAAEGLVLISDEQTAGRGRRERKWDAPSGTALLLSALLRPTWLPASESFLLTMLAAVALADAVDEAAGIAAQLKWPNDLLLQAGGEWRKAAGILVDLEVSGDMLAVAVLGIGLNVSWHPAPDQVQYPATSIAAAGSQAGRHGLAQALLRNLDAGYSALQAGHKDELFARWRDLLLTLDRPVRVDFGDRSIQGIAEDVTPEGILLVRDAAGDIHRVLTGDVSLR